MRENSGITFTASTLWLLPMYKIPKREWDKVGIENAYLYDTVTNKQYEDEKQLIRILCKVGEQQCLLMEDVIDILHEYYIDMYSVGKDYVVLVLRIPIEMYEDYDLVMEGRYSQLSEEYKDIVSERTYSGNNRYDAVVGKRLQLLIAEKDPIIKKKAAEVVLDMDNVTDGEIWEKPIKERETITSQLIDKLNGQN